ncbi:snurportin-1 [Anopheles nili]|uniref:snurportin-1 n=1 Tax=Anopheles nili TaxID=185578 RepID=UPI00237C367D|nr:snurportin-1 [Anopheles nili]
MSDNEEPTSRFIDQYKNHGRTDSVLQEERRQRLLEKQKASRELEVDAARLGLLDEIESDLHDESMEYQQNRYEQRTKKRFRAFTSKLFANKVQLSEWMHERPSDLENWLVRPCPVGQRCLLVFRKRMAVAFNKRGRSIVSVRTKLNLRAKAIVLDSILSNDRTFYILDALALGQIDLVNCECQFRFAWIESKFHEDKLGEQFNAKNANSTKSFRLSMLPSFDLGNPESMHSCWESYPAFTNDTPRLDGYLFYHKESFYVYGQTPLVVWLFPFMLNDVIKLPPGLVNERYLSKKPATYTGNYAEYIKEFDRQLEFRKRNRRNKTGTQRMETTNESLDSQPDDSLWEAMEAAPLDSDDEDLQPSAEDAMRELEMEKCE